MFAYVENPDPGVEQLRYRNLKPFFFHFWRNSCIVKDMFFLLYLNNVWPSQMPKCVIVLYTYVKKKVTNAIKRRGFDLSPQIAHGYLTNSELISLINTLQRSSVTRFKSLSLSVFMLVRFFLFILVCDGSFCGAFLSIFFLYNGGKFHTKNES